MKMVNFKDFVKKSNRNWIFCFVFEQQERKEKFLNYWCYESIFANFKDAFELRIKFFFTVSILLLMYHSSFVHLIYHSFIKILITSFIFIVYTSDNIVPIHGLLKM